MKRLVIPTLLMSCMTFPALAAQQDDIAEFDDQDPQIIGVYNPKSRIDNPKSQIINVESPKSQIINVESPKSQIFDVESPKSQIFDIESPKSQIFDGQDAQIIDIDNPKSDITTLDVQDAQIIDTDGQQWMVVVGPGSGFVNIDVRTGASGISVHSGRRYAMRRPLLHFCSVADWRPGGAATLEVTMDPDVNPCDLAMAAVPSATHYVHGVYPASSFRRSSVRLMCLERGNIIIRGWGRLDAMARAMNSGLFEVDTCLVQLSPADAIMEFEPLIDNVGLGQLDNVGLGQLDNVGLGQLDNVGLGQLDNVGLGQLDNVGLGQLDNVGLGQLDNVGLGQLDNVGLGGFGKQAP